MTRFFIILLAVFALVSTLQAQDVVISKETSGQINGVRSLTDSDKYDNKGVLEIFANGTLNIAGHTENIDPPGGALKGLNLGVVKSVGNVNTAQTIWFQEGSEIGGSILSLEDVVINGASILTADIRAKTLQFNASQNKDNDEKTLVTQVDLSGIAAPDVDEWVVNGPVSVKMTSGNELTINSLVVKGLGTSLNVSENLTVLGNYTGGVGSTIGSQLDGNGKNPQGTIKLLGGGDLEDGTNNLILQSKIDAKELQVKNRTNIEQHLLVSGDFTVLSPDSGKESIIESYFSVQTNGKMTVQSGGTLRLKGESNADMLYAGYYYFNGLFYGGLNLQDGATLETIGENQMLAIALGDTSEILFGSKVTAHDIHFAGMDTAGSSKERLLKVSGELKTPGDLALTSIKLENVSNGKLEVNHLSLRTASTLNLSSSGAENGGLTFVGENPKLDISGDSLILATGKTLDFTGVIVVNNNPNIGIQAKSIVFGAGGSLQGPGGYETNATFKKDSTLKLGYNGHLKFGDKALWFQEGSKIELTIGTGSEVGANGVGAILTNGKITMEEGVLLEIADASQFDGRTKVVQIMLGAEDSEFNKLTMKESNYFKLNESAWQDGAYFIEILKFANLVDYVNSHNQRNLGLLIDELIKDKKVGEQQQFVFDQLMKITSDEIFQYWLDSLSGATRENSILFALSSPWRIPMENIGFKRLSLALNPKMASLDQEERMTILGQRFSWKPKSWMPKKAMPRWSLSHDLWGDIYYNYTSLSADGNASGGNGNRGGFFAGASLPSPSRESLIGLSFGYSAGQYKQGDDKVDLGDFQLGVYGGTNLFSRNLQLRGYIGYGIQSYDIKRNVLGLPAVTGKPDGDSISAAFYLIRPVDISERYLVKPMLGLDLERVSQDGFTEQGLDAIRLSYGDTSLTRTMLRLGISGDYMFDRLTLNCRFTYGLKVAGDNTVSADHRFMSPADTPFRIDSVNLGGNMFDIGFGGNFGLNRLRTALLFLDYNAALGSNSSSHTASVGVLWKR